MKRTLIPGLMLLAAFTLTNCSEQLVPPVQEDDVIVEETPSTEATEEEILGIPFEVYANASDEEVDTKTTNVNGGNFTAWEATDAIYVYHKPSNDPNAKFTKNFKFSMRNLDENLFGGALASTLEAGKNYDWYFIYPNMEEDSGSAGTQSTVYANLVIGAAESDGYIQTQKPIKVKTGEVENTLYSNKNHIAGDNYPMYGKASVKGDENPRIKMKHLSALVALKIVNQGDGVADNGNSSIEINNVEFVAPEEVVGNFNVTVSQTPIKYDKVAASATAKVNLVGANGGGITIEPGEEALVYFAVKPFTAKKDAKITIKINGSPRTVQMPNDIKFEAGKVTTLRVPVKLSHPKASDALDITSKGRLSSDTAEKIITLGEPIYNNINGESTPIYVVGSEGSKGTITIKGFAKDMINALPVGFYASCWNDKATAMTIKSINLWMPEYGRNYSLSKRTEFKSYSVNLPVKINLWGITEKEVDFPISIGLVESVLGVSFQNGITREVLAGAPFNIAPSTITFNGLVPTAYFDYSQEKSNVVILDENPVYKDMSIEKVNSYLTKFNANGKTASYEGVKAILNANMNSDGSLTFSNDATENSRLMSIATETAEAIIGRVQQAVGDKTMSKSILGVNVTVTLKQAISPGFFKDILDFMHKFRDMKFELVIETYPYAPAYTTATPETTVQPIVFWGFDANVKNN